MSNIKERPNYIDLSKAIGMFCVILGHFIYCFDIPFVPNSGMTKVSHFVTLFHMPFFFTVSGLVSSFKVDNIKQYFVRQCKTLLLPYIVWGSILGLGYTVLEYTRGQHLSVFPKFIIALISGSDFKGCSLGWASQLWFVYALFFIKILIGFGVATKNMLWRNVYFGILLLGGITMLFLPINPLPFRIDCILVGLLFVIIGYKFKEMLFSLNETRQRSVVVLLVSALIITLLEMFYMDNTARQCLSINANYYGNIPALFLVSGVSGAIMLLSFSKLTFVKYEFIRTMSNGLICYLALHKVLFYILHKIYNIDSVFGMVATSLLVFAMLYPITLIVNKFFPFLLGFRK